MILTPGAPIDGTRVRRRRRQPEALWRTSDRLVVLPVRRLRRLHGPATRREPARRLHRRPRDPEDVLQPLAREMAFSETVFVYPAEREGHVRIRIFTPAVELRFAGHPVLGSAFVLAGPLQLEEIGSRQAPASSPSGSSGGREDRLRPHGATLAAVEPYGSTRRAARGARRPPSRGADRAVRQRDAARLRRPPLGKTRWRAPPDLDASASLPDRARLNCAAGRASAGRRGCSHRPRRARGPGDRLRGRPSRRPLVRHGLAASGDEIEISQGVESAGRRCSTRRLGNAGRIDRVEVGGSAVVLARGEFRL